jgi:hypothetical protein
LKLAGYGLLKLWIALTSNNLCGPQNWYEQDWDNKVNFSGRLIFLNTFGWREVQALSFLMDSWFVYLTSGIGPNPNTNLLKDSVSD